MNDRTATIHLYPFLNGHMAVVRVSDSRTNSGAGWDPLEAHVYLELEEIDDLREWVRAGLRTLANQPF